MTIKTLLIEFFICAVILFGGYWIATAICYLISFMF